MSDLSVSQNLVTAVNFPDNPLFNSNLSNLSTRLGELNGTLNAELQDDALSQNTLSNNIIQNEIARLNQQRSILENAQAGQQRILNLNDSYRKRYKQYLKMVIAIVVILVIIWVLQVLNTRFEGIIPSYLFDLITVVIASIGLIYCYLVYSDIGRYNPLNYDELNIAPPPNITTSTSGNVAPNSITATSGADLTASSGCVGEACCATGTVWDPINKNCKVPSQAQAFTTLSQSMASVEPNTPFEYSSYAPLY